jgi:sugar/nucleoside kinase (ribokinase family)
MPELYDVAAIGNAIVDVIAPSSDDFLAGEGLAKGGMTLIDEDQAQALYGRMGKGQESSGGSAANTIAGIAGFGGRTAYMGKVAPDALGEAFTRDIRATGVAFSTPPLVGGLATARCLINVTPDGQRTMSTFLGASSQLSASDVDKDVIEAARVTYLEGYLFDPEEARRAFAKAAGLARASSRLIALTLSDAFVVDRHRKALLQFIETEVDVVFANEVEIKSLFETEDFDAAIAAIRGRASIAAITRSEKGSVVVTGGEVHPVGIEPTAGVLDTTGAGDQYAAGFLYGLSQSKPLPMCARLGHVAAAEVISHYGGRPETSLRDLAAKAGL